MKLSITADGVLCRDGNAFIPTDLANADYRDAVEALATDSSLTVELAQDKKGKAVVDVPAQLTADVAARRAEIAAKN